jgi:hypothetical protein
MRVRILASLVVLAAVAVVALPGAGAHSSARAPAHTTASNRRVARADARALLAALRLPARAVRLAREPAGDHGYLRAFGVLADEARAAATGWWRVPHASPAAVLGYLRAHVPPGAKLFSTGGGGNTRTGTHFSTLTYSWAGRPGVLGFRGLNVTVTALSSGAVGVGAQSQSDWIVARSPSERVPAGVRSVRVELQRGTGRGLQAAGSFTLTAPARVRRLVALVDSLPIAQPLALSCPADLVSAQRVVRLRFVSGGGEALARAVYTGFEPEPGFSGQCNAISFSVRGRMRTPLIGGSRFLRRAERIAGRSLIAR